jgi:ATP-dependent Clp protease protease subunit
MSDFISSTLPSIIQKTNRGISSISILDDMFSNREIQLVGSIDKETVYSLSMQLLWLEKNNPKEEITIFINSPGGEVSSGLALYDIMQTISAPIRTVCIGTAASMAAVLFAAGDKRQILPHGAVMIHDPLISGGVGGSALTLDAISKDLMRTRSVLAETLAKHTGKTVEEILEVTSKDTYFYGQEAIDFGLADEIIEKW